MEELFNQKRFGFNSLYYGIFDGLTSLDLEEIIDNLDPNTNNLEQIKLLRETKEDENFDIDHYIGDFITFPEESEIPQFLEYISWWDIAYKNKSEKKIKNTKPNENLNIETLINKIQEQLETIQISENDQKININTQSITKFEKQNISEELIPFSSEELEEMIKLPRKEYIIEDERDTLLGLLDIIFSYAYNHRTSLGENTVESGWNIVKVSPTLSWFDKFISPKEVIVSCIRRTLIYPLYRYWDLSIKIFEDVKKIFKLGKRAIMRALLDTRKILIFSQYHHYLNKIYVEDYCIWVQKVQKKKNIFFIQTAKF